MTDRWKDVVGYEGLYKVSDTGKIYSLKTKKELVKWNHTGGYSCVSLMAKRKKKNKYVHRIVAEAFIDNPNNFPQINHKDENKRNNNIENLEWCTDYYNRMYGTARLRCVQNTDFKARGKKLSVILSSGPVFQYDLNGKFIQRHVSAHKAACSIDGKRKYRVSLCLKGEIPSAYGYVWANEPR